MVEGHRVFFCILVGPSFWSRRLNSQSFQPVANFQHDSQSQRSVDDFHWLCSHFLNSNKLMQTAPDSTCGGVITLLGVGIRGTLGDIDPLNKVPFQRATSRGRKGPLQRVSLILPRNYIALHLSAGGLRGEAATRQGPLLTGLRLLGFRLYRALGFRVLGFRIAGSRIRVQEGCTPPNITDAYNHAPPKLGTRRRRRVGRGNPRV